MDLIYKYQHLNEGEAQYHTFLILSLIGYYVVIINLTFNLIHMFWYVSNVPPHIHPLMNKTSVIENWWGYQRTVFIVVPRILGTTTQGVPTQARNIPRGRQERRVIFICPHKKEVHICTHTHTSIPLETPGGSQVDPEDFSCATYLYHCKHDHKLKSIIFPNPRVCYLIITNWLWLLIYKK